MVWPEVFTNDFADAHQSVEATRCLQNTITAGKHVSYDFFCTRFAVAARYSNDSDAGMSVEDSLGRCGVVPAEGRFNGIHHRVGGDDHQTYGLTDDQRPEGNQRQFPHIRCCSRDKELARYEPGHRQEQAHCQHTPGY